MNDADFKAKVAKYDEQSRKDLFKGQKHPEPTADERAIAVQVLRFYKKLAANLVHHADQDYPSSVSGGLDESERLLLEKGPVGRLVDYLTEYRMGHED